MRVATRLSWFFAVLAACAAEGEEGGSAEAVVELGTGTTDFEALAEESELVLVAGPQGGHHFVVHARMRGLDPGDPTRPGLIENPSTRFTAAGEDGERLDLGQAPYRLGYERQGVDYFLPSGRILQVREEEVPALHGRRARIDVRVTDADGRTASDGRWVVVAEPGAPPPLLRNLQ